MSPKATARAPISRRCKILIHRDVPPERLSALLAHLDAAGIGHTALINPRKRQRTLFVAHDTDFTRLAHAFPDLDLDAQVLND